MPLNSDDLIEAGIIGKQIEEFFKTPVGQYLDQCADAEMAKGFAELESVSFWKFWRVKEAQNRVWRGRMFQSWVREAISAGIQAVQLLENREDGDEP